MIFTSKNVSYYLVTLAIILGSSYLIGKYTQAFESNDEYDMIRKYLLNDSPLYGYNRPKLWIHTKYEINSRRWKDFYSRNTTDLNQPYIHLTIKTIIDHCGDDFNICLIDDQSFSKLLPSWDIDLANVAEPMREHFRELGLCQLLYFYGGMVVPNSLVCLRNLKDFYDTACSTNMPFVCENINRNVNNLKQKHKLLFVPDLYFFGSVKNDPTMLELIEYLKKRNKSPHFTSETDFVGDTSQWCLDAINKQKMTLVGGELTGVKTEDRKTIVLEDLMEEGFLNMHKSAVGIYIPADEILNRPKYQWFAVLPSEQILNSNMIISKYLMASIVDTTSEYSKSNEIKSVVSI
uniref:Uncharacterized protein n=1 Tax=viral metagenome TaxID=1070528 RepID=A0A6C0D4R8_9ZZZZ